MDRQALVCRNILEKPDITQREMAKNMDISLGTVNGLVKECLAEGYIAEEENGKEKHLILLEKGKEGMKADMDGVIASVDALQTNMATQGVALFTIASTENVRVKIEVSPDDYEKMKTGSAVSIKVGEHTYQGTLTETIKSL